MPDCIFYPTKPSFLNYPALSPSPYLRKLIHLTFRKNTTPFPAKNPATPPRIKVSARATQPFPHAVGREFYTTWQNFSFRNSVSFDKECDGVELWFLPLLRAKFTPFTPPQNRNNTLLINRPVNPLSTSAPSELFSVQAAASRFLLYLLPAKTCPRYSSL